MDEASLIYTAKNAALKVVYQHENPDIDIIAVHGLGSNGDWAWAWKGEDGSGKVNWLSDEAMLPSKLPKSRIMTYSYESRWDKDAPKQRLKLCGDALLNSIRDLREEGGEKHRPIIFVCHSFGGNVTVQALVTAAITGSEFRFVLRSTAGIAFLGTPHRGTKMQSWASKGAAMLNILGYSPHTGILDDLKEGAPRLQDVLHEFCLINNTLRIPIMCFFELYETDYGNRFGIPGVAKGLVVSEGSACIDGCPRQSLEADHLMLNKFSGPQDRLYCKIYPTMLRMSKDSHRRVQRRLNPAEYIEDSRGLKEQYPGGANCIQALFLVDPHQKKKELEHKKGVRVEGTCQWIQFQSEYACWLNATVLGNDNPTSQLLWLSGEPGQGKTMMSLYVIDETIKSAKQNDDIIVLYYFFDADNREQSTPVAALRGILLQFLRQRPHLLSYIIPAFNEQQSKLFTSYNALWEIFLKMKNGSCGTNIYCVLDALDECESTTRATFLRCLTSLCSKSNYQCPPDEEPSVLRLLITSRRNSDIEGFLDPFPTIRLRSEKGNHTDVDLYIRNQVAKLARDKKYNDRLKRMVEEHFTNNAEATFLWVSMAVKELENVTSYQTTKTLKKLPKGLDSMYQRILSEIDDEQVAKDILSWVTFTFRPLTVEELYVACGLGDVSGEDTSDMTLQYVHDCIAICRSILTIQDDKVIFVHQSAKDFLLSLPSGDRFFMSPKDTHAKIANCCLDDIIRYFAGGISPVQTYIKYSGIHWPEHAALCSGSTCPSFNSEHPLFLGPLLTGGGIWGRWLAYLRGSQNRWQRTPAASTPLDIAATWGILDLATHILGDPAVAPQWLRGKDVARNMAVRLACVSRKYTSMQTREEIVKLLLENSADAEGEIYRDSLQAASSIGSEAIVKLLLEKGADVNAQGGRYGNALQAAACNGHENIVKLLLEAGVGVNVKGGLFGNALHAASSWGKENIVRLLLKNGAEVNSQDGESGNALLAAASRGHENIVRLLLDAGAEANAKGGQYGNALQAASLEGHENIVKLLLEKGAEVNVEGGEFGNALQAAASRGHENVVALLLEKGADINAQGGVFTNALQASLWKGHENVVKLLLEKGAEVDVQGGEYRNALQAASWIGHENMVKLLLERRAEVDDQGGRYAVDLQAAAIKGVERQQS